MVGEAVGLFKGCRCRCGVRRGRALFAAVVVENRCYILPGILGPGLQIDGGPNGPAPDMFAASGTVKSVCLCGWARAKKLVSARWQTAAGFVRPKIPSLRNFKGTESIVWPGEPT